MTRLGCAAFHKALYIYQSREIDVILLYMCTNHYFDMKRFDKVIAKLKPCSFFCSTVYMYFVFRLSFTPVLMCLFVLWGRRSRRRWL